MFYNTQERYELYNTVILLLCHNSFRAAEVLTSQFLPGVMVNNFMWQLNLFHARYSVFVGVLLIRV